ncbi:MAG TPA: phospholipase D-like domain-containing protein, partial [Candidatus Nitrosocosmicus sp.]|nr:phospholipase D-like domain-containing protein [Candidatus Nitrosocosmicus sp.]
EMMEQSIKSYSFRQLMVSPLNMRRKLVSLIHNEIKNAQHGKPAKIQLKVNNLVDKSLINKLLDAAKAGVEVQLIVRGVCCLIPKRSKKESLEAISIVGRYLEHSRFMIFANNDDPLYYISSADWMERNLDKRIEVSVPVYDTEIRQELSHIFSLYWSDTVKARILDRSQKNNYRKSGDLRIHAQEELIEHYRHLELQKAIEEEPGDH